MHKLKILDQTGHTTLEFDPKNAVSTKEAMERFAELTSKGYRAAVAKGNGDHEIVPGNTFDPEQKDTLLIPPLQGG